MYGLGHQTYQDIPERSTRTRKPLIECEEMGDEFWNSLELARDANRAEREGTNFKGLMLIVYSLSRRCGT